MRERLVGLGHLVRLFLAANGATRVVHRVHDLAGEAVRHGLARALARGLDDPAHRERLTAVRADLDWDLVRRATDATRLDLDERRRVAQRLLEDLVARLARRGLDERERSVEQTLSGAALAALHQLVVEVLDDRAAVLRVRLALALLGPCSAWHLGSLLLLGIRVLRAV